MRSFARQYGIDLDEAEKPVEAYSGLQEFFTRRLREGARPIAAGEDVVVSPADGTVVEVGTVHQGMLLDAKDAGFTLADLLADGHAAARLDGGPYCVTYLSPRDYHRVHSPVAGRVVAWHYVPGRLFPVNSRSVLREPGLFSKNERLVTLIEGAGGLDRGDHGGGGRGRAHHRQLRSGSGHPRRPLRRQCCPAQGAARAGAHRPRPGAGNLQPGIRPPS